MTPATATILNCLPLLKRRKVSAGTGVPLRSSNVGDEMDVVARRRPCWVVEGKCEVLSTPAKLAVGFGRVDCPAHATNAAVKSVIC